MAATKIEAGILLELKRLVLTSNARKHNPEKIASLAKSLKELDQQLEDIIVCPQGEAAGQASPLFDVLAGGGRKEAEESLGWEKARCTILYGLSPYEKLKVMLDENKEREETTPLDEARIYDAMIKADKELNQEKLAPLLGMPRGTLANYLSLLNLPAQVQEIVDRSTILGLAHLLQLCRLKIPEDQITLAQEADQKGLTVKQLKALVDKKVKGSIQAKSPYAALLAQKEKDPYSDSWPTLLDKVMVGGVNKVWCVKFENANWLFKVPSSHISSKEELAQWFGDMARGLRSGAVGEEMAASGPSSPTEALGDDTLRAASPPAPTPKPRVVIVAKRVVVPVPQIKASQYMAGNKLQITWGNLGAGFTYQLLFSRSLDNPKYSPIEEGKTVATPGAVVNVFSYGGQIQKVLAVVQAIDPEGHWSDYSEPVPFNLTSANDNYGVWPLSAGDHALMGARSS